MAKGLCTFEGALRAKEALIIDTFRVSGNHCPASPLSVSLYGEDLDESVTVKGFSSVDESSWDAGPSVTLVPGGQQAFELPPNSSKNYRFHKVVIDEPYDERDVKKIRVWVRSEDDFHVRNFAGQFQEDA